MNLIPTSVIWHSKAGGSNTCFFFKQWGAWGPDGKRRSKKANGRLLFGRIWDDLPGIRRNVKLNF